MKVSLNWVKEYTKIDLPVDELVEKIGAQLGAVEEVIDLGKKYQGIVIAKVVTCQKHPNADKLSVCTIDDGGITPDVKRDENGHVEVVCGAPNVAAGQTVAWLPPGTTVPSTHDKEPFVLEARELRSVISNGMIASAHELAISDDHNGIVVLDDELKPGSSFVEAFKLNDYIIDIENKMFTHRPDCFGILGVAREIAGIQQQSFKSPDWYLNQPSFNQGEGIDLKIVNELPELVPRFMAVAIKGVSVGPSPLWLQADLTKVGLKPINNIVDITNYMMMETAQPLHAYDADKLRQVASSKDQVAKLETRKSRKGDTLKLLGGKVITFENENTVLITSGDVPVGIGGVMGGADTEVDVNTKNIVIECANFDMYAIRRTAMEHGLFTDAVTRFTKGQSPLQNDRVLHKAMAMTAELASGQQASNVMDINHVGQAENVTVHTTQAFVNQRLGLSLTAEEMVQLLRNTEFILGAEQERFAVRAPFWRTDIEIPEDIVEEIGRLYGFDDLPLDLPESSIKPAKRDSLLELKSKVRDVLAKAGANEVLTYSFVDGNLLEKVGQDNQLAFELSNALSPDLQYYRVSLIPSLLERTHPNIKAGYGEFALFEIGKTHAKGHMDKAEPELPRENNAVSLVFVADEKSAAAYDGAAYYQARKYLVAVLADFGVLHVVKFESLATADLGENTWLAQLVAPYQPNRSAVLRDQKGIIWGVIGEFKASVRRNLKLPDFAAGFEFGPLLLSQSPETGRYVPLPKFPKVEQDISLKVPADLPYDQLYDFVWDELGKVCPKNSFPNLGPIDIYQRQDDQKHKQITLRYTVASYERTLTAEEVNAMLDTVAAAAKAKFGAVRL